MRRVHASSGRHPRMRPRGAAVLWCGRAGAAVRCGPVRPSG
ncbi:hypothetical protein SLI_4681 [Streptomyces lividans 1326]|uniref:Uncharacterized protein n=1 Tax=Streptomyces lividans 1326 TaxID=1200984 RepID=A0A7U9HCQ4_STRLI|nr:hypothetical protein SLI_4681 [Streptomyces lividans 1326]